jgi:hypothetical protein
MGRASVLLSGMERSERLAVTNLHDEVQYYTTAIKAGGCYFYCKDDATVEITDYEYHRVNTIRSFTISQPPCGWIVTLNE